MVFQKLLEKLGSQIKLAGLSLLLPLSFIGADASATVIKPPTQTQHSEITSPAKGQDFLIAWSDELNLLFDATVFSTYRVKEMRGHYNYSDAYSNAWDWFYYITVPYTITGAYYSDSTGYRYQANLKGGGTANIRERGTSGNFPTIDTYNHGTYGVNGAVTEIKFKY